MFFKKRCSFCKGKIERGEEFFKEVKDPIYTEKRKKAFCCPHCAKSYEDKSDKSCCKNSGGCC